MISLDHKVHFIGCITQALSFRPQSFVLANIATYLVSPVPHQFREPEAFFFFVDNLNDPNNLSEFSGKLEVSLCNSGISIVSEGGTEDLSMECPRFN